MNTTFEEPSPPFPSHSLKATISPRNFIRRPMNQIVAFHAHIVVSKWLINNRWHASLIMTWLYLARKYWVACHEISCRLIGSTKNLKYSWHPPEKEKCPSYMVHPIGKMWANGTRTTKGGWIPVTFSRPNLQTHHNANNLQTHHNANDNHSWIAEPHHSIMWILLIVFC
jgi:hypothetical protein